MAETWIADASAIITLSKAGHIRLLADLPDELIIPAAVSREVLAGPSEDSARKVLEAGLGRIVSVDTIPEVVFEWGLGEGETAVLALALQTPGAIAVLDDASARKCATALGVRRIGTLGLVVRARQQDLIPSAAAVIRDLRRVGFHLDTRTVRTVLAKTVGEDWAEERRS